MSDVTWSDDDPQAFDALDEAIAAAYADAEEGSEVAVHSPTCTPEVHVVRRGQT